MRPAHLRAGLCCWAVLAVGVVHAQGVSDSWTPLPFSAVKPQGWLAAQIRANLEGFTGHLDSLAPGIIVKDDIYGKDRLTNRVRHKDLGVVGGTANMQAQYLWWDSESQGNWWDGFIRSAVLVGDTADIRKARAHVRRILSTQDPDGYLGIYDRDLRYHFQDENGELWSKTTLLRGLLAWFAYTRDSSVLRAITRAVRDVMRNYPEGGSRPFYSIHPDVGGLSHGLMFTDILEQLYRISGDSAYLNYAAFLYRDFSREPLHEDAQESKLLDPAYRLQGHGVHTYEHLRAVAEAYYATGDPELKKALDGYLGKIASIATPTGGPVGDEWIGRASMGYEYCSVEELMDSYADLLGKTGDSEYGDLVERLFFNPAQGSRDPNTSCGIAYLKTDNSFAMDGPAQYKYSPVHQDVAVCCVPNAGRIAPYYVSHMWMRTPDGWVAALLGPCRVKAGGVTIEEKTGYPNDFTVRFSVQPARPGTFALYIRKPSWADSIYVSSRHTDSAGLVCIRRKWRAGDEVVVRFFPRVRIQQDRAGDYFYTYGPLVLAHPIPSDSTIIKKYNLPGFYDLHYVATVPDHFAYLPGQAIEGPEPYSGFGDVRFRTVLVDLRTGKPESEWLRPMGGTVLRQVTFSASR